jgi:glycosyltransferase involved in cell wall biosynthesis
MERPGERATPGDRSRGAPPPLLTIGLPVFNGARYLESSVDSILSQSLTDFELIISDNASTDETESIARSLVARDHRVHYRRNARNAGISTNFNVFVPLARGQLFKWATSDDLLRPGFLERCVAVLEADADVVLAYAAADFVDGDGVPLDVADPGWHLVSDDVAERLRTAIGAGHFVNAALGVIRLDALRRTRLVPRYSGGDYRLMAELAVLGKFVEIPDRLYVRRIHGGSTKGNMGNTSWLRMYYAGTGRGSRAAYWRLSRDRAAIVLRSPIPIAAKVRLLGALARTMISNRVHLFGGLVELVRP